MSGRTFLSLREAIHATATGARLPMKALASELDYSPSELSMRTTLGGESARPFPADDEHLVRLMRVTGDASVLYTLADLLGYEVHPKADRVPELVAEVQHEARELGKKLQLLLDLGPAAGAAGTGAGKRR